MTKLTHNPEGKTMVLMENEGTPAANEVETLRGFLSVAMTEEKYEKARQYMYLIEYITGEFSDDNMMMA